MRAYSNWQWHLDKVFVKINGEMRYLWRAVDHEEVAEWSKAHAWKVCRRVTVSRVRIPVSPPLYIREPEARPQCVPFPFFGSKEFNEAIRFSETGRWLEIDL
jgi:hypothetical protein